MVLCMQNSDFRTRLTSLYGSQTSSVVLSTHNSVLSTRLSRLYGFQPSPVVFCMENIAFWTRITSLWVQDPTCGFCMQNSDFWTTITSLYGTPTWPVVLCMYISVLSIRNTSLYWFQSSSVVFASKTTWLAPELIVSMCPSPRVWFLDAKQRHLDRNNKFLCVPDKTCRFVHVQLRA